MPRSCYTHATKERGSKRSHIWSVSCSTAPLWTTHCSSHKSMPCATLHTLCTPLAINLRINLSQWLSSYLPLSYNTLYTILTSQTDRLTLETIMSQVLQEEQHCHKTAQTSTFMACISGSASKPNGLKLSSSTKGSKSSKAKDKNKPYWKHCQFLATQGRNATSMQQNLQRGREGSQEIKKQT